MCASFAKALLIVISNKFMQASIPNIMKIFFMSSPRNFFYLRVDRKFLNHLFIGKFNLQAIIAKDPRLRNIFYKTPLRSWVRVKA